MGAHPVAAAADAPLIDAMAGALMRPAAARANPAPMAPPPRDILVLSGGGPWGAWGAGVIAAWPAAGPRARPARFDLVTGVSTGALQATFAFLGAAHDPALVASYAIAREEELVRRRSTIAGAFAGAFADTAPLAARVRAAVTPLIGRVAEEGRAGRLLLVGAVDALDGRMYAIDLTRIARELAPPERDECFIGALMASAAVPIAFDRVEVGGRPYFDGGVRQSVFVTQIQSAAARAMAAGMAPSRLFILVNGALGVPPVAAVEPGLLPTLARVRTLALHQIATASIADVARAAPPGFTTYVAAADDARCGDPEAGRGALFDPAFMACLTRDGRARWDGDTPWRRFGG